MTADTFNCPLSFEITFGTVGRNSSNPVAQHLASESSVVVLIVVFRTWG